MGLFEMSGCTVAYHELVSILGEKKSLFLSITMGGDVIYIPTTERLVHSRSVIVREVGMAAAAALAEHYGGEQITIPVGPGRRAVIWALRQAGWTIGDIARLVFMTQRTVYNILRGNPPTLMPAAPPPVRRARQLPPPLRINTSTEEPVASEQHGHSGMLEGGDGCASPSYMPSIRVLTVV
jgi:hypothetical protein